MPRIAINLLPIEFRVQELKRAKFYKIQAFGVVTILLVVFLSSLTIALRILQSQNISQIQNKLTQSEQRIADLKSIQGSLFLLKNRLTVINQYLEIPSKQVQMYKLIAELLPATVSVGSIFVDKGGEILILAVVPDSVSLDHLITNLISKESNQDKISKVSLENISRGKDGIYRLSLKVKPK